MMRKDFTMILTIENGSTLTFMVDMETRPFIKFRKNNIKIFFYSKYNK